MTAHIKELSDYLIQQSAEHNIEQELQEAVRRQMENNQREYFLNEKMKAIKSELSDLHEERGENYEDDDIAELEKRLAEADLPEAVRKKQKMSFVNSKPCLPPLLNHRSCATMSSGF